MAVLYHVTTPKKAKKYHETGHICKPVRGFTTLQAAMCWAIKTQRSVIYEVSYPDCYGYKLPGMHQVCVFGTERRIGGGHDVRSIAIHFR